ncbi:MAG: isoprenyl transferase [Nitrospirae bacterium]|nr:isoprenyl transferase [Nitrospirota bacterium]MBI5695069.1 isoprenyl transferase [Nitrospirota bacterium]
MLLTRDGQVAELSREELLARLDTSRLPRHVAIIMDGNGRWAANRGLPRVAGHKKGMETVREIVTASSKLGIKALTLYAFSLENWKRPRLEVEALMSLLTLYLQNELKLMQENNIKFTTIGRTDDLPGAARKWIDKVKAETAGNTGMVLDIALSYGGRWEIMEAAKKYGADLLAGRVSPQGLTEEAFSGYLDTAGLPELDLVIRTSGEMRISNFLLWQTAYAELYFTDSLWPDFGERELIAALVDYQGRERRFGRTGEQLGAVNGNGAMEGGGHAV